MATETLNPNGNGTYSGFSLSEGSDRSALVNDGDDATYLNHGGPQAAGWWYIIIDGTSIYDADTEPGGSLDGTTLVNLTRVINSTNFSGCPTLTKDLITSLEIGMRFGAGPSQQHQTLNIDNPTFSADATINSATINGRLSYTSSNLRMYELSLVVDYTEPVSPTLLKLKSGRLILKGGTLLIK
tara:strand:+ start:843 stop:1394 length:552 start_codon:yes stop_codon:yes gene_type:complete